MTVQTLSVSESWGCLNTVFEQCLNTFKLCLKVFVLTKIFHWTFFKKSHQKHHTYLIFTFLAAQYKYLLRLAFKTATLLSRKYVLTFSPLIHVLNSKNPNAANNTRTPKQFQFPTFYLLRSGFQDRIVAWPSSSSRRSCAECHSVCIRFIISWNIFPPIQTEYFPEQTRQVRRTYLPWLLSALFDLCLCGRRRVSSVPSSVGEGEG